MDAFFRCGYSKKQSKENKRKTPQVKKKREREPLTYPLLGIKDNSN